MTFRHHIPYGSFGAPGGGQQEAPEQTHLTHLMTPKGRRIHVYMSKWKFIEAPSRTFSYRYGFIITYYFQGQPAPQSHTEQTCSSACRLQLRNTGSAGVSLRSLFFAADCELLAHAGCAGVTLKSTPRLLLPKCAACALQLRNTGSAGDSLPKLTLQ